MVRAIYWSKSAPDLSAIKVSLPVRLAVYGCVAGMFYLGMFPNYGVTLAKNAVAVLVKP